MDAFLFCLLHSSPRNLKSVFLHQGLAGGDERGEFRDRHR